MGTCGTMRRGNKNARRHTRICAGFALFAAAACQCSAFAPPQQVGNVRVSFSTRSPVASRIAPSPSFQRTLIQSKVERRKHSSELRMANVAAGVAAITGAISGGLFAGSLHAVSGPDHLAALIPRCCGQRWYKACRVGALWGMGHGISAFVLGVLAVALKNGAASLHSFRWVLRKASSAMEIAVGVSLVLIGLLGLKEAREWQEDLDHVAPQSLSAAAADVNSLNPQKKAVIFNGLLHGLSWDGAPSLAPALAVATWRGSITFLISYAIGTVGAMTLATILIGEGTLRAGQMLDRPDIPQKVSFFSSAVAILIGAIWCGLALK